MGDREKLAAALMQDIPRQPVDEAAYQKWRLENNIVDDPTYNMRGFYRGLMGLDPDAASSINPNDQQLHFPDKWKMPNHPTFSTESAYYNPATMQNTPTWQGGKLPNGGESWVLRKPNGEIVSSESPWLLNRMK